MCILRRPRSTLTVDYTLVRAHVLEGRQQLGRNLHNINLNRNLNRNLNLKLLLNLTGITDRTAAVTAVVDCHGSRRVLGTSRNFGIDWPTRGYTVARDTASWTQQGLCLSGVASASDRPPGGDSEKSHHEKARPDRGCSHDVLG